MFIAYPNPDTDGTIRVPAVWAICDTCSGNGTSSAYLGAFTSDDLAELGHEFCEDYTAGRYDRACPDCDGTGKVLVIDDEAHLTDTQRAAIDADDAWQAEKRWEASLRERGIEW